MALSRQEVERVSLLARLRFSPARLDNLTTQLGAIVSYIDQLAELPTDGVEPWSIRCRSTQRVCRGSRRAEPQPRGPRVAPHSDDECYLVPAVLGE